MILKFRVGHAMALQLLYERRRCGFQMRFRRGRNFTRIAERRWPLGEGDTGDLLEVIDKGDVVPRLEQRGEGVLLAVADLEGEQAVWFEGVVGLGDEAAVDVEAGFAGEERGGGFVVADLGVEGGAVGLGDVGRVADDGVEGLGFVSESG